MSLAAAAASLWPLLSRLTTAIPLGTEREATVPLFILWPLWWPADRVGHGFRGYLDAPIFFPNHGVTTWTETMPLVGTATAPLWAAGAPPALIYNVALLGLLTLNGVFAYRLVRSLGAEYGPALVAAVLAVTLPYPAKVLGVLPSVAFFGMFWTLEGLVRFGRSGSWRAASWAALGFAATFLTWQQYAVYFLPVAAMGGAAALYERRFARRALLVATVTSLAAAAALLAVALPSIRIHDDLGLERPPALVKALSARPGDYFSRPLATPVAVPPSSDDDTAGLFPGLVLLGLSVVGVLAARRERANRRWVAVLSAGAVVGVLLSLGLNLSILGWEPFGTLRRFDVVNQIRSPYRAAAVLQVCLVPLAGIGVSSIARSLRSRAALVLTAIALVAFVENLGATDVAKVPRDAGTAWTAWVGDQPEGTVLAHVPFAPGFRTVDFEPETLRMFAQTDHGHPLVNGYSGYLPTERRPDGTVVQSYLEFLGAMRYDYPNELLTCILAKNLGADLLVMDEKWAAAQGDNLAQIEPLLEPAYRDADVRIFRFRIPADRCRPAED